MISDLIWKIFYYKFLGCRETARGHYDWVASHEIILMRLNKGVYYKRIVKNSLIKEKNVLLVMMGLEGHFFKLSRKIL